jgi:5'-nucleotidase (lipoprotein e(P4) family)
MKKQLFILLTVLTAGFASAQNKSVTINSIEELKLYSTLWQQDAAEYRALCYQAFNTAKMRLDEIPKRKFRKHRLAIITDIDETIFDNSYQEAQLIKNNESWNMKSWLNWTNLSVATAVPGAVEFLQYAGKKGVSVFYVSNRGAEELKSTLINLENLHFPNADSSHALFMANEPSKETRRQEVMKNYDVVMLMGDNLNDFAQVFEGKNISGRFAATDNARDEWGNKFIVLPNVTYGEWENALFQYQHGLTAEQKLNMLRAALRTMPQ